MKPFFILLSYGESLTVIFLPTEDKGKIKSNVIFFLMLEVDDKLVKIQVTHCQQAVHNFFQMFQDRKICSTF